MNGDFGEAVFMDTIHQNEMLVCESRIANGHFYLFQKTKDKRLASGVFTTYYQCRHCSQIGGGGIARTSVINGRVMRNPDGGHNQLCAPIDKANVEALKLRREIVAQTQREGVRPLQVYRQGLANIPRRFPNQEEQEAVELAMPPYKRIRSS